MKGDPPPHSCLACASFLDVENLCANGLVRKFPVPDAPNMCMLFIKRKRTK